MSAFGLRTLRASTQVALIFLLAAAATSCHDVNSIGLSPQIGAAVSGVLHGGRQPVVGSSVQLYAAGSGANDGSAATALLLPAVTTDATGSFSITSLYHCPSASSQVYLVGTDGNPGLGVGQHNPNIALMAALGTCGNLTASTYIFVDEVTTVAAVSSLLQFMKSATALGSGTSDLQQLLDAFAESNQLANTTTGFAPGPALPSGFVAPTTSINSLGNIVAACINSAGGTAGQSNPCGQLFLYATPPSGTAPTNTIDALIDIFNNPTRNVSQLFGLTSSYVVYLPDLTSAPSSWALKVTPGVTLSVSPKSATVDPGFTQQFTATVTNAIEPSAQWQVNGIVGGNSTVGTISSSGLYTAPSTLAATTDVTITAVANADPTVSDTATVTDEPNVAVAVTPTPVSVVLSGTQQFTATVTNPNPPKNSFPSSVTWSLSGTSCPSACGSISSSGLYTAPSTLPANTSVTVIAASTLDPHQTGSAVVTITSPPLSLSLTPSSTSITIKKKTTQSFTATVTNDSTNSGVTWTLTCTTDGYDGTSETPDCVSVGTVDTDGEIDNSYMSAITSTSVTVNALPNFSGTLPNPTVLTLTATTVAKGSNNQPITKTVIINVTN